MADELNPQPNNDPDNNTQTENQTPSRVMHTFEDDMALAMNATDAHVVQEMIQNAQKKEAREKLDVLHNSQRKWYTAGGIILMILALGAIGYGIVYYRKLTVPANPAPSVGVFPSTNSIYTTQTSSVDALSTLKNEENLSGNKPYLVPLMRDTNNQALSVEQTFSYLGIPATEPFMASMSLIRLGVMNNGKKNNDFLIFSTPNPEIASRELLIAEPSLLDWLTGLFQIDRSNPAVEIAPAFSSSFMYNLPVRILKSHNLDTGEEMVVLYYGYANNNTVIVATDPSILKAVYDTIIQQH